MIRVLLAEDQGMMRGALALLLDLEPDLEVVSQVAAGDEVVPAALALAKPPDVALLDIEMPGMDGLAAAGALRTAVPGCRVLILTTFGRPGYLRRAMEAGASGFLVKDSPVEELANSIRRVLRGETVIDPALAGAALSAGPSPLTDRERDVLAAAAGRGHRVGHRGPAAPVRVDGPQLPVRGDRQDRYAQPHRSRPNGTQQRLALISSATALAPVTRLGDCLASRVDISNLNTNRQGYSGSQFKRNRPID